jgi:hypothetical protein
VASTERYVPGSRGVQTYRSLDWGLEYVFGVHSGGVLRAFVTSERATGYLASYDVVRPDVDTAETGPEYVWWYVSGHSLRL